MVNCYNKFVQINKELSLHISWHFDLNYFDVTIFPTIVFSKGLGGWTIDLRWLTFSMQFDYEL